MGRNAAQLREAAVATGMFDGPQLSYVGDGYSLPWQTGVVPFDLVAYSVRAWKSYLDEHYLEASRLHDWLYTPYGPELIGATQEEADDALEEEMLAMGASALHAAIVANACRVGGHVYFGRSLVGYVPRPIPQAAGDNITSAGNGSLNMADYKVVMIFQQTTAGGAPVAELRYAPIARTGGWSESYFDAGVTLEAVLARLRGPRADGTPAIAPSRAALLSSAATLVGARIYEIGVGRGELYPIGLKGTYTQTEQPQAALLCATALTSTPTVRRFTMRGIPDNQISGGEFNPTYQFISELQTYLRSLAGTNVRGRAPSPIYNVFSITENGLVTLTTPLSPALGSIWTFKNCLTEEGFRRGGEYVVSAVGPMPTQFTIQGWLWGDCTGGTMTQVSYSWFTVGADDTKALRITTHRIGRPFVSYRGRKSSKKGPQK